MNLVFQPPLPPVPQPRCPECSSTDWLNGPPSRRWGNEWYCNDCGLHSVNGVKTHRFVPGLYSEGVGETWN